MAQAGMTTGMMPQQAFMASQIQMFMTDMQQAQTVYTQIAADAQKQQMEREKIKADLQTKIFEVTQDITVNKQKTADKAFNAMDGYIRG
jgi:hypothetical protein